MSFVLDGFILALDLSTGSGDSKRLPPCHCISEDSETFAFFFPPAMLQLFTLPISFFADVFFRGFEAEPVATAVTSISILADFY